MAEAVTVARLPSAAGPEGVSRPLVIPVEPCPKDADLNGSR